VIATGAMQSAIASFPNVSRARTRAVAVPLNRGNAYRFSGNRPR
jgi:hypothetical protein